MGCSPWGRTESDTTERFHFHFQKVVPQSRHGWYHLGQAWTWFPVAPISWTHEPLRLTWDFQVQVTDAANSGHRRGSAGTGDALLDSSLPADFHGERAPCKNREGP